jgi:hypothetical protein
MIMCELTLVVSNPLQEKKQVVQEEPHSEEFDSI